MLDSFPVSVLAGAVFGFLTGLGVGGGSLLILWLTLALGIDPQTARGINLLFFLPASILASTQHFRRGDLRLKPLLPAVTAGCLGAAVFSWVGTHLELELLKKLFGCLLLITGLRELFYRPRKKGNS